ncbi:lytic transglycosylase domain-containing protein [Xanthobacteraceae bacterium A53D]
MMKRAAAAVLVMLAAAISASSPGHAAPPRTVQPDACEKELHRAAAKYQIPLPILYAIGLTETGMNGKMHPFTMYMEGKDVQPKTLTEAVAIFKEANGRGVKLIDIGCMQANWYWHHKKFPSLEAMFDPRENVDYAAKFLRELRDRHGSWTMAAARYNAGPNNDVAQKRYVCRVMKNLVAAGVGNWTPTAKAFCDA